MAKKGKSILHLFSLEFFLLVFLIPVRWSLRLRGIPNCRIINVAHVSFARCHRFNSGDAISKPIRPTREAFSIYIMVRDYR